MNTHSNRCNDLALLAAKEFTCDLRADYFYPETAYLNKGLCTTFNGETGALDAPGRIPAGSMQRINAFIDSAYQLRG